VNANDVDLNLLRVLSVLFEERNVTRAGERLGRTQSAVSNALARLRGLFGDPLLVRGPDGMLLTPRAEALVVPLREMMRQAEACVSPVDGFDPATARGALRIGAPDRLSLPLLLPLLQQLRDEAPELTLHLATCDGQEALDRLHRDLIDLAIGWFDRPPAQLRTRHAFDEEFVCLCRDGHPLAATGRPIGAEHLLEQAHLVVSAAGGHRAAFDALLARRGQARRVSLSVTNFSIVPQLLRGSDLVGVFTRRVAGALAREFALACVPLAMGIEPLEHLLVWHGRNDTEPRQQWLRERVLAVCAAA